MTSGMSLASNSSPCFPAGLCSAVARKYRACRPVSLSVVRREVESWRLAAVSDFPVFSRSCVLQNLLVMVQSSNNSPIAPPVLKSSSIALMNLARQSAAAFRSGSLALAEAAGIARIREIVAAFQIVEMLLPVTRL